MVETAKRSIVDEGRERLGDWLSSQGVEPYRANQIFHWIVSRRATSFAQMTDLPADLRAKLADEWLLTGSKVARRGVAEDGTIKLLLELADGQMIECVLIPDGERRTACLSTQVGCGMGCVFCASGLDGVARNLTTTEIIEELLHLERQLPAHERIDHIVVMGMGEPLANLEALTPALGFATDGKWGLGISARNVTVSTVGLPEKIRKLASLGRPYHLAVSLHAPNDELRRRIVPTAEKLGLRDILSAADDYRRETRRQVTFEYVLLGAVNDGEEHARELARLLKGRDAMINLIPYNPVSGLPYRTPEPTRVGAFADILRDAGFVVKVRKRKGSRIDAACGQLRRTHGERVAIANIAP